MGGFARCFGHALGAVTPSSLPRASQMRFGRVWAPFWRILGAIWPPFWGSWAPFEEPWVDFKSAFGIRFAKVALRGSLEMIWGGASFCGSILIAFSSAFSSEAPVRSYCQRHPPEEYNKLLSAAPARRGQQAAISGTRPQRTRSCY